MKGRPKDPTRARRRTGHRRKPDEAPILRALPAPADPQEETHRVTPPEDLAPELRIVWDRIVETLNGVPLRSADSFGIEALVRQYHRMRQAGALVDQYGVITRTTAGDVAVSPFVKAERDATAAFLRLAEHYGLTVASRMRLGLMQLAGKTLAQALADDLQN